MKFLAKFDDTCWLCGIPLWRSLHDITKVNRKIRDGRTTRPTICKKCVIQMYEQKAA